MSKKTFFLVMLIVAAVDLTTITGITVYASSKEELSMDGTDVGKVHQTSEESIVSTEGMDSAEEMDSTEEMTEMEETTEKSDEKPEYDETIGSSLSTLYNDLLSGDYEYDGLEFHFGNDGKYSGFFDDSNPNVTDYTYEITTDAENTVLNIYNDDDTAMVSYYLVFSDDYEEVTLIYSGDASLKLHLKAAGDATDKKEKAESKEDSTTDGNIQDKEEEDETETENETENEDDDEAEG